MVSCYSLLAPLIASGDLHAARFAAWNHSLQEGNSFRPRVSMEATVACAHAWSQHIQELFQEEEQALAKIDASHRRHAHTTTPAVDTDSFDVTTWDKCCRRIEFGSHPNAKRAVDGCSPESKSCVIGEGSGGALLLPLVNELQVRIRLPPPVDRILTLDQDGIFQPFDVSTVLWPAGYLLTLFVNDLFLPSLHRWDDPYVWPMLEGWHSFRPTTILELGAGIGSPSIAAALAAEAAHVNVTVVATDSSPASLALTTANAAMNGVKRKIRYKSSPFRTHFLEFTNQTSRVDLLASFSDQPFDLVMGASLEYELWEDKLYEVLGELTQYGGLVVLVHTSGELDQPPPQSSFVELGRISGAQYGMHIGLALSHSTGADESQSCFEIVLWKKMEEDQ